MVPGSLEKHTGPQTTAEAIRSVTVEASSTHPADWGRAMALALNQLIQEVTAAAGTDPCRDPNGLDLSLHVKAVPAGEAITVVWRDLGRGALDDGGPLLRL